MKQRLIAAIMLATGFTFPIAAAEIPENIKQAVASKERMERESVRDAKRKPAEVLALMGVEPGMTIADLSSGGGYYTELFSRAVGDQGKVIAHNVPYVINKFSNFFFDEESGWPARLNSPQWQKNVEKKIEEMDTINLPVLLDGAFMGLFYHDMVWQGVNREMMNRRIFNALKPGGVYVIVDHSAKPGRGLQDVKTLHRIDKQTVIEEITSVGFKLDVDSDLLSHPEDTRDYPFQRDRQTNRDATDRMVLKFVKPLRD